MNPIEMDNTYDAIPAPVVNPAREILFTKIPAITRAGLNLARNLFVYYQHRTGDIPTRVIRHLRPKYQKLRTLNRAMQCHPDNKRTLFSAMCNLYARGIDAGYAWDHEFGYKVDFDFLRDLKCIGGKERSAVSFLVELQLIRPEEANHCLNSFVFGIMEHGIDCLSPRPSPTTWSATIPPLFPDDEEAEETEDTAMERSDSGYYAE